MNDKSHLTSRHLLVCIAVIALAVAAVAAGAGAGFLLLIVLCPLMMGAMMWMMMRGMNGRDSGS